MALITNASTVTLTAGNDTETGSSAANAFIVDNTGPTGQDTINFGKNDSLLTTVKLYDSNDDGIITFGGDKRLDTSIDGQGDNEINMVGVKADSGVRYLGTSDGYFVYADAKTKSQYGETKKAQESKVSDDVFDASGGDKNFFFDTALGLNLGADKITGFGAGDKIITTSAIYDSNNDGVIHFGANHILDLPGGGTLDFGARLALEYTGSVTTGGVTYFTYVLDLP